MEHINKLYQAVEAASMNVEAITKKLSEVENPTHHQKFELLRANAILLERIIKVKTALLNS